MYAATQMNKDVVKYLTRIAKVDATARDKEGKTALMYAVSEYNTVDVVEYLVRDGGADVNAQDNVILF
jgi:ankyrin repeat protein